MERGQSTVEVAIAFPVAIIMLWWAAAAPISGLRALAARSAAVVGARRASVEDSPERELTARRVEQARQRIAGSGSRPAIEVALSSRRVSVTMSETGRSLPKMRGLKLFLDRERD